MIIRYFGHLAGRLCNVFRTATGRLTLGLLGASLMFGAVGLTHRGVVPAAASACDGSQYWQQDQVRQLNNFYMHYWMIDLNPDTGSCRNTAYKWGQDSRYSWGGNWHNVQNIDLTDRVWVCGQLRESDDLGQTNRAYGENDSQAWDYQDPNDFQNVCGHQADTNAHYNEPSQGWHWDSYLALDHHSSGTQH